MLPLLIVLLAPGVDVDDPATCTPCHQAIVGEWSESLHRQAHHSQDPIYAALRSLRMRDEGPEVAGACAKCHTPRAPVGDVEGGLHGVSCAACHGVQAVKASGVGRDRFEAAPPGVLLGPHDVAAGASPAHGTGPAPAHFADGSTLCMACHEQLANPRGVGMCATGLEWQAGGQPACTHCHMPEVATPNGVADTDGRHRDHRFFGHGMQADNPAALTLAGRIVGDTLVLTATNQSGHALPTGFPGRVVQIELEGFDGAGRSVWRPTDVQGLALRRAFFDAAGAPTMPHQAVKAGPDTRLVAGEARLIPVAVPSEVQRIEAWAVHLALPPPVATRLGLPPLTPRLLGRTTIQR